MRNADAFDLAYGMGRIVEMLVEDVALVKSFRDKLGGERWLDALNQH